jgi:hypothetical protein
MKPMHRQTQSYSIAPGHWAENAPLIATWVRPCLRIMLRTGRRLQCFFYSRRRKRKRRTVTQFDQEDARSVLENTGRNGLYKTVLPCCWRVL